MELKELEPELHKKSMETEELMQRLTVDQEKANKVDIYHTQSRPSWTFPLPLFPPLPPPLPPPLYQVRTVVAKEEAIAKTKASETEAIANDAQKDLDQALPALQAANKVQWDCMGKEIYKVVYKVLATLYIRVWQPCI